MKRNSKIIVVGGLIAAASLGAAGVAVASTTVESADEGSQDAPIMGTDLEQASAAALAHTGGGRVTDTEVGDEESLYEVEVTLDDGSQVDVQLDERFGVVGAEREDGGEEDELPGG